MEPTAVASFPTAAMAPDRAGGGRRHRARRLRSRLVHGLRRRRQGAARAGPRTRRTRPTAFKVPQELRPGARCGQPDAGPAGRHVHIPGSADPEREAGRWWIPAETADAPAVVLVHGVQSCRREASVLLAAGMLHRNGLLRVPDGPPGPRRLRGRRRPLRRRQRGVHGRPGRLGLGPVAGRSGRAHRPDRVLVRVRDRGHRRRPGAAGDGGLVRLIPHRDVRGDPAVPQGPDEGRVRDHGHSRPGAPSSGRGSSRGTTSPSTTPSTRWPRTTGRSIAFVHGAGRRRAAGHPWRQSCTKLPWPPAPTTPDAWIVPGAGHTQGGIYVDPTGYERRLVEFFGGALGAP